MPITVVLADSTVYREEPEMFYELADKLLDPDEARRALEAARGAPSQYVFSPADLATIAANVAIKTPLPRTIGIVGAELERAIADVLRYRAAVEDEQRLRAELDALLGRPARKRKGGSP